MISVRKSEERGHANHGWLISWHTFSFADYYDPSHLHFRALRVINEDIIAPAQGFGTHPHRDMEILTYVLAGTLEHTDTMNNRLQITASEFQLMSAGKGVQHSEFNPSKSKEVHLFQIWIEPEKKGVSPSYQQKNFAHHQEGLKLVVSPDGREGSLKIHQAASVYLGRFKTNQSLSFPLGQEKYAWIQITKGIVRVNGVALKQGDGAQASHETALLLEPEVGAELLLFDLS